MYGPNLVVRIARRDTIDGEPVERIDLPLQDGTKNVLLVLKVDPEKGTPDLLDSAAKWLGEQCERMNCRTTTYHGVVLFDSNDVKLEVVEVDETTLT